MNTFTSASFDRDQLTRRPTRTGSPRVRIDNARRIAARLNAGRA